MKMVKMISVLTLITLSAITLYSAANAKKTYEESSLKYQELKGRLYDVKTSINALSEQLAKHRIIEDEYVASITYADNRHPDSSNTYVSTCLLQA